MRFSRLAASLVVGGLGALGLVGGGCGDDTPQQQQPAATCKLLDTCVNADPACIALTDNKGAAEFGLRMSQIVINKPASLAPDKTVGKTVSGGVTLNRTTCFLTGDGTFSWLLHFDTATNTICTGGAKPPAKPDDGYSFVKETINQGGMDFMITPVKFTADIASGTFSSPVEGQDIVVPIYTLDGKTVLLPLRKARLIDAKLSSNNNCIGSSNLAALDPYANCDEVPEAGQFSFINGGKLEGYITLEDADSVVVDVLNATLCTVLTNENDGGTPLKKCKRDMAGKIAYKGDWCDATNKAADATCADAVQLGADFAASAVKINGGCPLP